MSKNILDNLFGSRVRVKLLKCLYRNWPAPFDAKTLGSRIQESPDAIRKEIRFLAQLGILKRKK